RTLDGRIERCAQRLCGRSQAAGKFRSRALDDFQRIWTAGYGKCKWWDRSRCRRANVYHWRCGEAGTVWKISEPDGSRLRGSEIQHRLSQRLRDCARPMVTRAESGCARTKISRAAIV